MAEREGRHLGNYRLLKLLGEGGFAEVYLGEHIYLGTKAAIKLLYTRVVRDEVAVFQQEARTLANLVHPNIVRVLDFGVESSTNTPYLVMDYAPGGTLRQRHPKGARLPLPTIVEYVKQIGAALQYAHDAKLIHRDVKPENMLIGRSGEVLLSDFGIALLAQSSRYQSTKDMAGTIAYMAPEQIEAHPRPASDQYALGIVVYEWLCGTRPFNGSFSEVAAKHSVMSPPPLRNSLPKISPAVEQVVMTALAKKPEARFSSVRAFATALEQSSRDIPAPPVHVPSSEPLSPISTNSLPIVQSPPAPSEPATLFVPPAPLMSSSWAITTQSRRSAPPEESEISTSRGISRRAVLIGAGGVIGVGLVGTGIVWLTRRPALQPSGPQGTLYVTYRGHSSNVYALAWSPDGKRIASGSGDTSSMVSNDHTVQVWDAADGGNAFTYRGHSDTVERVAWSPDGNRIASSSDDSTVQVWGAADGGNVFTYRGHADRVFTVAWSPDGKRIASGSVDKTVQVWDAATGGNAFTYRGHSSYVFTVAWSPDGKRIASGSWDKTVQVWDAANGGNVFTYRGHSDTVDVVVWSPDGKRIASGSVDKTVQVWDVANGGNVFTYRGHGNQVDAVAWSPDGRRIASSSDDVQVWDAANGGNAFTYRGQSNGVFAVAWSPDGKRIASSGDKTVQVWQAV